MASGQRLPIGEVFVLSSFLVGVRVLPLSPLHFSMQTDRRLILLPFPSFNFCAPEFFIDFFLHFHWSRVFS